MKNTSQGDRPNQHILNKKWGCDSSHTHAQFDLLKTQVGLLSILCLALLEQFLTNRDLSNPSPRPVAAPSAQPLLFL